MNIVAADPDARVLSRAEVLALLAEPLLMRLGLVDEQGWPVVNPVWHLFDDGVFHLAIGKTSLKARLLRATGRAYFTVDKGGTAGDTRGVRGRATARLIEDVARATDVTRRALVKYTGTDAGAYAEEMLRWARDGELAVAELRPAQFRAFAY
jgi:nitroimidazol reductase NimA-like FMN-containing flavoprotein (pyridoxamine 5'-phosphate oxidase superfamily)